MAASDRDGEALREIRARSFPGARLVDVACEMRSRRLTVRVYGALGPGATVLGTMTFYNATALTLRNEALAFPESIALERLTISYDDGDDRGALELAGVAGWTLGFAFDGVAYEEQPFFMTSLEDELASEAL